MNDCPTATFTVLFRAPGHPQKPHSDSLGRAPRVTWFLALAHEIERRIRAGELDDLAHAARTFGLTRARITQIVSLTLLAPQIQEEILAMPPVKEGRDPISERALRSMVAEPMWGRQIVSWQEL